MQKQEFILEAGKKGVQGQTASYLWENIVEIQNLKGRLDKLESIIESKSPLNETQPVVRAKPIKTKLE